VIYFFGSGNVSGTVNYLMKGRRIMKKIRKLAALVLMASLIAGMTSGCSKNQASSKKAREIYFLNFKPEIADKYKAIVSEYEKKTGVHVKVVTAASGTYEQTLKAEVAKSDPPTIFQINGLVGYKNWKDYCADLSGSKLYSYLQDKSLAIKDGDGVYGIPYAVEAYGIIYNDSIMKKYFALPNKAVSINSADEIKNFQTLKQVVEDMTKHKSELGIDGVFASTSLTKGEEWRWQTHLANLPFYYEFKENTKYDDTVLAGINTKDITFKYNQNYKNIFDLYINNSTVDKKMLGSKSVADSMSEFALGKAAMVQNGVWAWSQISGVQGNVIKDTDVKFMPIYTGIEGEEQQGLCIGTENFFAINSKASKEKQQDSLDFLDWLFSSTEGKKHVIEDLGFIAPFNTFTDSEKPQDPLAQQTISWMKRTDVKIVPWTFESFPSQNFKDIFGAQLLQYCQGKVTWDDLVKTVIKAWKVESEA